MSRPAPFIRTTALGSRHVITMCNAGLCGPFESLAKYAGFYMARATHATLDEAERWTREVLALESAPVRAGVADVDGDARGPVGVAVDGCIGGSRALRGASAGEEQEGGDEERDAHAPSLARHDTERAPAQVAG